MTVSILRGFKGKKAEPTQSTSTKEPEPHVEEGKSSSSEYGVIVKRNPPPHQQPMLASNSSLASTFTTVQYVKGETLRPDQHARPEAATSTSFVKSEPPITADKSKDPTASQQETKWFQEALAKAKSIAMSAKPEELGEKLS